MSKKINFYPAGCFLIILLSASFDPLRAEPPKVKEKKPNIIFLLADDLRDNMFGIMGHSQVKTPNFDKLISQSVRFSNTYIAEPVCAPSRVSLFTGMPERIHGVGFSSSYQLTEAQWDKTYPALLQKNGYYTGFIGKFGVEYYSFRGKAAGKFDYWYGHDGWTKFFPKDYDNFSCNPYHQAKHDIITPIMGEAMNDFLNSAVDKGPFCLSVSFNVPHGSQATSMYADYPEWHEMIRPANENPKLKGHPIYDALYRNTDLNIPEEVGTDPYRFIPQSILDQDKGRRNQTYTYAYHPETSQEHHVRYFQLITGLDEVIGQLMDELKQRSLLDNTIIIFGSDHGLLMGEYGMGGKALLYDLTAKIPCFIYDPRIPENERGKTLDQLVSSLDIPVTILDYAGINPPAEMSGSSLIPLIKGEQTQWRDELFLESLFTLRDNPFCEGIRKGPWKYVRMFDGVAHYTEKDLDFRGKEPDFEQLFNLNDDPEEKFNLAAEYNNSKLLNELRGKVKKYAAEVNRQRKAYLKTHQISVR